MANFKHFSDLADGSMITLTGNYNSMKNAEFAEKFPGIKGVRRDSFTMVVMYGEGMGYQLFPLTRSIQRKSNPSRHECDARCVGATGRTMQCECKCGGKNHGRGAFSCAAA